MSIVNDALEMTTNETDSILQANQTIKKIYSKLTNCYYQKCALATPAPTSSFFIVLF